MFSRREDLNPKVLWLVVLLLTMVPVFTIGVWYETFILFSLVYAVGICVPLWFAVQDEDEVDLYAYMSIAAFFALFAPFFASVMGVLVFSIPFYRYFPIDVSLTIFSATVALWFMVRLVRRLPLPVVMVLSSLLMIAITYLNHSDSHTDTPKVPGKTDKLMARKEKLECKDE
ncbi:MAG TPA: hypothetical protein VM901_02060 [Bdellovibrionota bacterium]|jgi:hypothetical protein|nr:hypothetical protein [Bdellovibrionota bacterium]